MAVKREKIHGYLVDFDESLKMTGIRYLQYELQEREAKTLFEAARLKGEAYFEDKQNRNFTLIYNRESGLYQVVGRQHD
jgi:metal-dependent hydrolase (beta-lactamase superfamily II)